MAVIKLQLPDDVETAFRQAAMQKFGYKKGAVSAAGEQALRQWSGQTLPAEKDSIKTLRGVLKHVKQTSVELQHEAWKTIYEKYTNRRKHIS